MLLCDETALPMAEHHTKHHFGKACRDRRHVGNLATSLLPQARSRNAGLFRIFTESPRRAAATSKPIENQTSSVDKQIKLAKSFPFGTLLAEFCNVASSDLSTKEDAMDATSNPVTFRIVWCRRQRAKARSNLEVEAWRAEEEGLRDAVPRRDHVHKHQVDLPSYSNGMCWASRTRKRSCMSRG